MTREEKIKKRKTRAMLHRAKRRENYVMRVRKAHEYGAPISAINKDGTTNSWRDYNSPTGYSQICSYRGICQSPCNGDC